MSVATLVLQLVIHHLMRPMSKAIHGEKRKKKKCTTYGIKNKQFVVQRLMHPVRQSIHGEKKREKR